MSDVLEQVTLITPDQVTPEVIPPSGPELVYIGEGAENVAFTVNPNATKYVVYANGLVLENL